MARAERGQDMLEGRVGDEIDGREGRRKSAHGEWISRGLAKGKDRN